MTAAAARLADDAALARVDARLAALSRCPRCFCLGPHVCTRDQLAAVATSRPGHPFAPSLLIDLEQQKTKAKGEDMRSASRRLGVGVDVLRVVVWAAGLRPAPSGRWKLAPRQYDEAFAAARRAGLPRRKTGR